MKDDLIAIITPVGNEIEYLTEMYEQLMVRVFSDYVASCGYPTKWLWIPVIDSYCTDGSDELLYRLAKTDERIMTINIGKCGGVARAYIAGIKHAISLGANKIIEVDVGHPVELIPDFISLLDQYPIVMGTRNKFINVPWKRRILSKLGTIASHLVLHLPYSDCTSGLQGFTSKVAKAMPLDSFLSTGHFYQTEFKFYCQFLPFAEVPFTYIGNNSSIKTSAITESVKILLKLSRQSYRALQGDYTPMSNDTYELMSLIREDIHRLIGREMFICGPVIQDILHRLLVRIEGLLDKELKGTPYDNGGISK